MLEAHVPRDRDTDSRGDREEPPPPQGPEAAPAELRGRFRELLGHAHAEARASAVLIRAARLDPPPAHAPLQRLGYGLALPAALARVAFADPALRRRYLRVTGAQLAVTLAVGLGIMLLRWPSADNVTIGGDHVHLTINAQAAFWSSLYAVLCVVEWLVLALSRDYQGALAREVSLAAGIPPEDDASKPSIRLNVRWMRRKLKARIRGVLAFGVALPLVSLIATLGPLGSVMSAVLLVGWTVYWAGVFAAAKSAHGWTNEDNPPDPVYLRAADRTCRALPGVIRWIPALYSKIARFFTRSLFAPASRFEASPYELTGLAIVRSSRYVPGLYLLVRPLLGVAAAHLLLLEDQRCAAAAASAQATAPALPEQPAHGIEAMAEEPCEAAAEGLGAVIRR